MSFILTRSRLCKTGDLLSERQTPVVYSFLRHLLLLIISRTHFLTLRPLVLMPIMNVSLHANLAVSKHITDLLVHLQLLKFRFCFLWLMQTKVWFFDPFQASCELNSDFVHMWIFIKTFPTCFGILCKLNNILGQRCFKTLSNCRFFGKLWHHHLYFWSCPLLFCVMMIIMSHVLQQL